MPVKEEGKKKALRKNVLDLFIKRSVFKRVRIKNRKNMFRKEVLNSSFGTRADK